MSDDDLDELRKKALEALEVVENAPDEEWGNGPEARKGYWVDKLLALASELSKVSANSPAGKKVEAILHIEPEMHVKASMGTLMTFAFDYLMSDPKGASIGAKTVIRLMFRLSELQNQQRLAELDPVDEAMKQFKNMPTSGKVN